MKDIPVILVCYNRPWHTLQVLKALEKHNIQNLYIFSDAPKTEKDQDSVAKIRKLIKSIYWTKPKIVYQEVSQGLAKSIVGATNYVFQHHDRLILLEDDCVPKKYYFDFIRRCLSKYEDNEKIFGINGYSVPIPEDLLANHPFDIYFHPRIGSWGWATWKRAWKYYDLDLAKLYKQAINNNIDINQGGPDISGNVEKLLCGQLKDVWTLNWVLSVYLNNGYYIYPTISQIQNIGCDGTGLHCGTTRHFENFCDDKEIKRLPDYLIVNQDLVNNYNSFFGQPKREPKVENTQNTNQRNEVKINNTQHSQNMYRDQNKFTMVADFWSKVDCSESDKNFYCFSPIRARSCKLIFDEYDASRTDWCEYWTIQKYLKDFIPFEKCLSVCCGTGQVERTLARLNVAKKIIGTDIAPGAIDKARQRAIDENLNNIEYFVSDLNSRSLKEEDEYDIIWANGALHHIEDLDSVIPLLYKSLKRGGFLISNEYVGPKYQQIPQRQQEIINAVKHIIPPELRLKDKIEKYDTFGQIWKHTPMEYFLETDPSECINSNNIIPLLRQYFDNVEIKYFDGSILFYLLDSAFYDNFDINNQNHRRILEMLFNIEDVLIETGEIARDNAHIICNKTSEASLIQRKDLVKQIFNQSHISKSDSFKASSILLYHRIADDPLDSQLLAVSPVNFEAHLKELAENYRVLPLHQLLKEASKNQLEPNTLAITVDYGYLDNLTNAVPLLEKYGLHATIFIVSGMVGSQREFWWDALERIFLAGHPLPNLLSIQDSQGILEWDLTTAQNRLKAYDELSEMLHMLPSAKIDEIINQLLIWAGLTRIGRSTHQIVDAQQLQLLASSASVEIGSHSTTHTRLSSLSPQQQQYEIAESKKQLESIIEKPVRLFSYPYGGLEDITKETGRILAGEGYEAGIANVQGSLVFPLDMYAVPRRLVRNWTGTIFAQWLRDRDKASLEAKTLSERAQRIINSSFLPWSKQKQTIQPQNKADFKDCFPVTHTEVFF
jgi:peptidoglycan/xylan/chitin deacetylase (PgdA/CDA1 family)/SAM-dependent methyltransferase